MKTRSKIINVILVNAVIFLFAIILFNSCKATEAIANKSGAQLWAENCTRCHNTPSPSIYSDAQWEVVGDHMRYKANLTGQEVQKIVEFLKSAN